MKTRLGTVLLSLILHTSEAQTPLDYHSGILASEILLAQEAFGAAAQSYSQVFKIYPVGLAKDAYNACQVAVLAKQPALFKNAFYRCAATGVPLSLLCQNRLIHSHWVQDSTSLLQQYLKGRQIYTNRIDWKLRNELANRYRREQAVKGSSAYKEIVYENFNRIRELALADRFPTELLIGPDDQLGHSLVLPTLCHYPYSYVALRPYLHAAVQQGHLPPEELLYLYGFNQSRTSVLYTPSIQVDTVHFKTVYNLGFGWSSNDTGEVNRQRQLVQLHNLSTLKALKATVEKYSFDYRAGY